MAQQVIHKLQNRSRAILILHYYDRWNNRLLQQRTGGVGVLLDRRRPFSTCQPVLYREHHLYSFKVAVYRVSVANQSELNTSPCTLTWILQEKGRKTQRKSWKTTYLKTVHVICTNSNVHIAKIYTHSNQKSCWECSKCSLTQLNAVISWEPWAGCLGGAGIVELATQSQLQSYEYWLESSWKHPKYFKTIQLS